MPFKERTDDEYPNSKVGVVMGSGSLLSEHPSVGYHRLMSGVAVAIMCPEPSRSLRRRRRHSSREGHLAEASVLQGECLRRVQACNSCNLGLRRKQYRHVGVSEESGKMQGPEVPRYIYRTGRSWAHRTGDGSISNGAVCDPPGHRVVLDPCIP